MRAALLVFGSLLVLTAFTVAAWTLHLPRRSAITLALLIAIVKGSLVAGWFMHLISERRIIYWVLALTAALFFPLLLFPMLTAPGAVLPLTMTLKAFHVVFITASALLAFFFAAWCLGSSPPLGPGRAVAGVASVAAGLGPRRLRGLVPPEDAEGLP